jgi:hypothetical protein
MELHPLERPEGYIVKTGPILEVADQVTSALLGLSLGMVCTALTRTGKSVAMAYLGNRFVERGTAAWLYCSMLDDAGGNRGPTPNDLLRALRGDEDGDDARQVHQHPLRALIEYCRNECDRLGTSTVIFGIDEAQCLSYRQLKMLKHATNILVRARLKPFVLLMAQPELMYLRSLLLEMGHPDLVVRFMSKQHVMRGLKEPDIAAFCGALDELVWPEGSTKTYTAHWAPELSRSGWRAHSIAEPLWAAFVRLARSISMDVENLQVGGFYVADAVLTVMRHLQSNPQDVNAAWLYDRAAKNSCFDEFAKVTAISREAFFKEKSRRSWVRSLRQGVK